MTRPDRIDRIESKVDDLAEAVTEVKEGQDNLRKEVALLDVHEQQLSHLKKRAREDRRTISNLIWAILGGIGAAITMIGSWLLNFLGAIVAFFVALFRGGLK